MYVNVFDTSRQKLFVLHFRVFKNTFFLYFLTFFVSTALCDFLFICLFLCLVFCICVKFECLSLSVSLSFCRCFMDCLFLVILTLPPHIHKQYTVCPGSSDPAEKKYLIYLHQKLRFMPFFNYYDTLG